jgi:hypothetical protein
MPRFLKKILLSAIAIGVLVTAACGVMLVLDIGNEQEIIEALWKTLSVIGILAATSVVVGLLVRK